MILKFQQGGLAPLLSYEPVIVSGGTAATTATKSSSSSGSDLTDKDLLEMLEKLDGLPSDMAVLTKNLQDFYINEQYKGKIMRVSEVQLTNFQLQQLFEEFNPRLMTDGINVKYSWFMYKNCEVMAPLYNQLMNELYDERREPDFPAMFAEGQALIEKYREERTDYDYYDE